MLKYFERLKSLRENKRVFEQVIIFFVVIFAVLVKT